MRPWQVWRHDARHRRARRRARVPGGRRPLLRRRLPHPLGPLRRDRDRVEDDLRSVVRPDRGSARRTAGDRAARTRARVLGRTPRRRHPRRPVPDRHEQRRRAQLPARGGERRRTRAGVLGRARRPPRRRPPRERRRVPRSSSCSRSASKGSRDCACMSLANGRGARARAARSRLHGLGRRQRGVRLADAAVRLHVARRAGNRRRLRHGHACRDGREGAAGARLRRVGVHVRPHVGGSARRRPRPRLDRAPQGRAARRHRTRAPLRLRLLRDLDRRRLPLVAALAARPRLRVRDRARARRRRAGPRLVRSRAARAEAQHVHRLHRLRRGVDRRGLHRARRGSSRAAGAPAAC